MKIEIPFSEAIGKTIEAIEFSGWLRSGQCVIVFSDGTFSTIGVNRGSERGCESVVEDSLLLFSFGDAKLTNAGVLSLDEMKNMRMDHERKKNLANEELEKKEFDRLKLKYGG